MKKKITYNLNNGLINPRYVGLVRASTPKNYEIEEYDEVPEHVININSCFSSSVNLHKDMELIDCVSEDDIFTIDFSKLNLDERTMLYFFFCVQCEKDTDVVFTIESHAIQRLWINCEMVCLCGRGKRQIHTLHLFAGNNVFCFQQHDSIELIKTTFRIKSLEIDQNDEIPLTYGNLCYQKGLIEIRTRYLDEFRFNGEDYHFLLYPIDCIHLLKGTVINMQIIDHISDTILYESDCYFYNLYTIKTSGFKYVNDNAFNYLDVKFSYFTIDGEPREVHTKIYLSQPENFINPVRDRTLKLLESDRTVEEKLYIEYVLSLNDKSQDVDTFHKWERIEKVISIIEQGEYYNYLRSEGEKVVCFHSDIDNTIDTSVWISPVLFVPSSVEMVLFSALTHPEVTDCPYPSALPMATTCCPTTRSSELPICAILIWFRVSSGISDFRTATTARSLSASVPLIFALTASSRFKSPLSPALTVSVSALATSSPIKQTLKVVAPSTT